MATPLAPLPRLSRRATNSVCPEGWGDDVEFHAVGIVAHLRIEAAFVGLPRVGMVHHPDEGFTVVAFPDTVQDSRAVHAHGQHAEMNRHLHPHAAAERSHRGHELRLRGEAAVGHHFRDVFVPGSQGIGRLVG